MPVIPLSENKELIVDEADFAIAKSYHWRAAKHKNGKFYVYTKIDGKHISYAKVIFSLQEDQKTFCKNGNSLDMRRDNILICSKKDFHYLIAHSNKSTTSRYYGVQYYSPKKKWAVQISVGMPRTIKKFNLEEEAAIVADFHALRNYGAIAKLNFPELSYEELERRCCMIMKKYDSSAGSADDSDECADKTAIKLSGDYQILIDEEDYDLAKSYKWHRAQSTNGKYYVQTKIDGKLVSFSKVVFSIQDDHVLYHKNGDPLDFRRDNIMICNRREFSYLIANHNKSLSSQYRGVYYHSATQKWRVQILMDGKRRAMTGYDAEEDAAIVADYHALLNYGKMAQLNFPELSLEQLKAKYQEVNEKYGESRSDKLSKRFQGKLKKLPWVKSSQYVGVAWDKDQNYWFAYISYKNRRYKFRNYASEIEAALAYDEKALELYGEHAKTNF